MNKSKKFQGQIMVIVLLFLAVLTIIAVGVTLNTSRDTKEQVADKQYQQYYSVGERIIVDLINYIGKESLAIIAEKNSDINSLNYNCAGIIDNSINCSIDTIPNTFFNESGTLEELKSAIKIEDLTEIDAETTGTLTAKKDQDLLFDFNETGIWDNFSFSWNDGSTRPVVYNTAWNISYDYYDSANNIYKTDKLVWDNSGGNIYSKASGPGIISSPLGCFAIEFQHPSGSDPKISITNNECAGALFLRIKPVMKTSEQVEITSLKISGGSDGVVLARRIITTTTSSNSGTTDSPSAVLETIYFLGKTPLSLFDYVLRTEDSVIKE